MGAVCDRSDPCRIEPVRRAISCVKHSLNNGSCLWPGNLLPDIACSVSQKCFNRLQFIRINLGYKIVNHAYIFRASVMLDIVTDECHIRKILQNEISITCEIDRRSIPLVYLYYFVCQRLMGIQRKIV